MKVTIVIEGPPEALGQLFAAGPRDLANHFIPEWFGVKPEYVRKVSFEEIKIKGRAVSTKSEEYLAAQLTDTPYEVIAHKDNVDRDRMSWVAEDVVGEKKDVPP